MEWLHALNFDINFIGLHKIDIFWIGWTVLEGGKNFRGSLKRDNLSFKEQRILSSVEDCSGRQNSMSKS